MPSFYKYTFPLEAWQFYLVIGLGILMLLLAIWLIFQRKTKRRAWLRFPLYAAVILGLVIIGLQPQEKLPPPTQKDAILLTKQPSPSIFQQLIDSLGASTTIYTLDSSLNLSDKAEWIPNIDYLVAQNPTIHQLHLLGNGLPTHALGHLDRFNMVNHLNVPPSAFGEVYWNRQFRQGDTLFVEGTYYLEAEAKKQIQLKGAGRLIGQKSLKKGKNAFQFKTNIKESGRYAFDLELVEKQKVIQKESIPFTVYPLPKRNVLILLSQPSFESKFLKKWLAENDYGVAIRAQISKEKYRDEWINVERYPLSYVSKELLERFDVVMLDHQILLQLSEPEQGHLKTAVQNNALAVWSWLDEDLLDKDQKQAFFHPFTYPERSIEPKSKQQLYWKNQLSRPSLPISARSIKAGFNTEEMVKTASFHTQIAWKRAGLGKIANSLLGKTYLWQLQGESTAYAALWKYCLNELRSIYEEPNNWQIKENLPIAGQSLHFQYFSPQKKLQIDGISPKQVWENIPLAYTTSSGIYSGSIRLYEGGWHQLKAGNIRYDYYVYAADSWANKQIRQQVLTNQQALQKKHRTKLVEQSNQQKTRFRTIDLFWFYVLVVGGLFLLWAEAKF